MKRDPGNLTYTLTLDTLCSGKGYKYQREHYIPKLLFLKEYFGDRFLTIAILDVGVGYGIFLKIAAEDFGLKNLHGMDPFPESIEIAKTLVAAHYERGDIYDDRWPFPEGIFDAITCFDVLEHLDRPEEFLIKAKRHLKPGGIVLISTPNKQLPYYMESIPLIGIPDRNPTHINIQPARYWRELAERHGYEIVSSWKGEHLAHIKVVPKVLRALFKALRIDARNVPIINAFEQAFVMAIRPKGTREQG